MVIIITILIMVISSIVINVAIIAATMLPSSSSSSLSRQQHRYFSPRDKHSLAPASLVAEGGEVLEVGEGRAKEPGDSKDCSDRKDSGLGANVGREGRGDPQDNGQEVQDEDGLQEPRVAAAGIEPRGAEEHDQDRWGD